MHKKSLEIKEQLGKTPKLGTVHDSTMFVIEHTLSQSQCSSNLSMYVCYIDAHNTVPESSSKYMLWYPLPNLHLGGPEQLGKFKIKGTI